MPFFLYSFDSEQREYRQLKEISLSGAASPLRTVLGEAKDSEWHAPEARILFLLGFEPPEKHRILIDLKPSDKSKVSLYRLRDIWGYSYDTWTPLALRLESVLVDEPHDSPSEYKQAFVRPTETKDFIYEFLYLNGGSQSEKWTWGMVGRVNAALLWPDALRYFFKSINRQLLEDGLEPLQP